MLIYTGLILKLPTTHTMFILCYLIVLVLSTSDLCVYCSRTASYLWIGCQVLLFIIICDSQQHHMLKADFGSSCSLYKQTVPSSLRWRAHNNLRGPAGVWPDLYLAVCRTDWKSDIGRQNNSERRGQFNSESTAGGGQQNTTLYSYTCI